MVVNIIAGILVHSRADLTGPLFESLITLAVRALAQAISAQASRLRAHGGRHRIDLIVAGPAGDILAVKVKLAGDDYLYSLPKSIGFLALSSPAGGCVVGSTPDQTGQHISKKLLSLR